MKVVSATLEDQTAQSNIRLFSTSSQVLTDDPQDNEEDDSSDDDEGHCSEDDTMTLKTLKTEKKRIISLQMVGTPPVVPTIAQ